MYGKPNRQLGAYQMSVQVPHRVLSKVPEKNICKGYRQSLKEIIQRLYGYKEAEIPEGHMMPDHGHLLLSIPPERSVSSFMGCLKGKSALLMFDKHANLGIGTSGQKGTMFQRWG